MYETFYQLRKTPFALTPDPSFMVMTDGHCNAKAGLLYAIMSGKGFTVLTGDAGTGKTTLLRSVINSIPPERLCSSFVVHPALSPDDFLDMAVGDFGIVGEMSKPDRLRKLHEFLLESSAAGRLAVLFVDEAHRLSVETLEEIRLMTNFETENQKLLQIVLVGQDELDGLLDRRELRQLKQRVEVHLRIGPLSGEEARLYINHRWSCASDSTLPFSTGAIHHIARVSHGIPRLINSICDNALLLGFAESASIITEEHVLEVSRDLRLNAAMNRRPVQRIEDKPSAITEEHVLEVSRDLRLNGTMNRRPVQRIEDKPSAKEEHVLEVSPDFRLNGTMNRRPVQRIEDKPSAKIELQIPQPVLSDRKVQRIEDKPSAKIELQIPQSVLNDSKSESSFFTNHRPKRSWWLRFSGAQKT